MARLNYEESPRGDAEYLSMDDKTYREPNSVHISDEWDTLMEDFLDDFDDYTDVDFPSPDDEF
ncbi:MAG: hypothetical protein R3240_05940 [Gammaproteobacteria bacterium]|nr:hypothetical protein [Gammaproteobacteria bacterium]